MANTLRFKRGLASGIPTALAGEPLFTTDTFDLYIGNGTTNTRFQKYIASGTTSQYLRGDGSLATFPSLTGFVPYTGATANVDLGTHTILAQNATISSSGSGNTATITHSSGSGIALNITKGGNGEGLYINKTSGSGNAATIIGTLNATTLVKSGGLSTEYLKADGSVSTLTNPITGTAAAGQVAYFTGATTQAGSNNLFWDNTNGRLGINNASPAAPIHAQRSNDGLIGVFRGTSNAQLLLSITSGNLIFDASNGNATHIFSTNSTERVRIFGSTGNFGIGTGASDSGEKLQVIGSTYISDGLKIGPNALTTQSIRASRSMTGSTLVTSALFDAAIQSDVTGEATYINAATRTAAASFTIPSIVLFLASQTSIGAGSTVTNQYGFAVASSLTGATNNYGFFGNIAAATGRWNLYMNGTANNYMNGSLSIGTTSTTRKFQISGTDINFSATSTSADATCYGVINTTTAGNLIYGINRSSSNSFMNGALVNAAVYYIDSNNALQFGTNNNARVTIFGGGNVAIGSTTDTTEKLQVTGTMKVTGASTIGGNLVVDTSVLFVDAANNRVGINNANPATTFVIAGNGARGGTATGASIRINNTTSGRAYLMEYDDSQNLSFWNANDGVTGGDFIWYNATGTGTERMRLSYSGNLGLGMTPNTWGSTWKALEIISSSGGQAFAGLYPMLIANAYNDGTNFIYKTTAAASYYAQVTGRHIWYNAPSGSANANITFTQAMTLTAAGRLILGAGDSGELLQVNGTAKITGDLIVDTSTLFVDATNNEVGIGTTSPNSTLHVAGSVTTAIVAKTANYTATVSDYTILCDTTGGGFTITLPAANTCTGRIYVIKKVIGNSGANNVTIDGNGAETIDGAATITLQCKSSIMIQSDGASWYILSLYSDTSCL